MNRGLNIGIRCTSLFFSIIESFYILAAIPLGWLISSMGRLFPKYSDQVRDRYISEYELNTLKNKIVSQKCYFMFASSAGELEQAIPVMNNLSKIDSELVPIVILFSHSGVRFARTQGYSFIYIKAPWDDFFQWKKLFNSFQPKFTMLIRYEIWPAFMYHANKYGEVYIANMSIPECSKHRAFKGWMLSKFDKIFCVSDQDLKISVEKYLIDERKILVTGDTKYDRVLERIEERKEKLRVMRRVLGKSWENQFTLVIGSGWIPDFEIFFAGWDPKCGAKIILAPHEPNDETLLYLIENLNKTKTKWVKYSEIGSVEQAQCIIVDVIGLLPEMYGLANLAFIGGGFHHRVHNVLEPSVRGVEVCFGPKFKNSHEACLLESIGLAKCVKSSNDFTEWFQEIRSSENRGDEIRMAVLSMCGASQKISSALGYSVKK